MPTERLAQITKQQVFKMGGKFHGRVNINGWSTKKIGPCDTREDVYKAIELEVIKAEKLILSHRKLGIGKHASKPKTAVPRPEGDTLADQVDFPEPYEEKPEHEVEQRIAFKSSNPALQALHEPEKAPININSKPRPKMKKPDIPRSVDKPKAQGAYRKAPAGEDITPADMPWPLPVKRKLHNGYFSDDGSRPDRKDLQLWIFLARQDGLSWNEMSRATTLNKSTVRLWAGIADQVFVEKRLAGGCPSAKGEQP